MNSFKQWVAIASQAFALCWVLVGLPASAAANDAVVLRLKQQFEPIMAQLVPAEPAPEQGEGATAAPQLPPVELPRATAGRAQLPLAALAQLYAANHYQPLWDSQARYGALIAALESLVDDGLEPEDYFVSLLLQAPEWLDDSSAEGINRQVDNELLASSAYLRAVDHLNLGKLNQETLVPRWQPDWATLVAPELRARLLAAPAQQDIPALFDRLRPQYPLYNQLRSGLADYRQLVANGGWPALEAGPSLKLCQQNSQVAVLRRRLAVSGEYMAPAADVAAEALRACAAQGEPGAAELSAELADQTFDAHLVEAVKAFQRAQYLEVDGAVGPATRAALNVSAQARLEQIMVNLDRARSLLHEVSSDLLLVDIAGFKVTYYKAHQPIWRSRVQVGTAYRSTPLFRSAVNVITLNPGWTVPPTIYRKDILPRLRRGDLQYLRTNNIRVFDRDGRQLDPAQVNWQSPGGVTLRQDPGPKAALGRAAIRFPNPHAVYLHDTPHQQLFEKSQRAFSSGCIRVERIMELVQLLLNETPNWDAAAIERTLAGGKTLNVRLAGTVPILLAYWTAEVNEAGKVLFKPDIYARDAATYTALKSQR